MILIAGLIGYMGLRPSMSEEDQIYHLIGEMEQAANRNDLLSLLRYVAEDYKDTFGHTRDSLKALALQAERSLTLLRVKVSVTGLVRVGSRRRYKPTFCSGRARSLSQRTTVLRRRWKNAGGSG